jgi:mono/diheme cytochrome c family protein
MRVLSMLTLLGWASLPALPAERVTYNRHIRAILSNQCVQCHGPDDKKREAGLRLDTFAGATARNADGQAAIVPGRPEESLLLQRVLTHDPADVMPPPATKKGRLSEAEVGLLRTWIAQGAAYEAHWSFLPLAEAGGTIDEHIRARLAEEGLTPSPEADRDTLLRRLSLDLTGLPPTPEELAAFRADRAPDAYAKQVERLLASPHYGEKWGRHWLDQARYADSNGYSIDSLREMWPYRDWVIAALNADLPFDRFTLEQLAGDLLPNPTKAQLVATGFHRNTLINEEGGTDREQFRVESVLDRVNTTGAVWLGLTLSCAQCHTHKFDPIEMVEYYRLMAFFNSTTDQNDKGAVVSVARGELFGRPEPAAAPEPDLAARRAQWEKSELARLRAAGGVAAWRAVSFQEFDTESGAGFTRLPDQSLLSDGRASFNDTYRVAWTAEGGAVAALRLRVLTHASLPQGGPGLAANGNFVLTEVELRQGERRLPIARVFADHQQPDYEASDAIDGDPRTGWAINVGKGTPAGVKMNADHELVLVPAQPVDPAAGPLELRLFHGRNEKYLIGRFALDVSATAPAAPMRPGDAALLAALEQPANRRDAAARRRLDDAFASARGGKPASKPNQTEVMVMRELPQPRPTYLLTRGDFTRPDKQAGPLQPGVLAAVAPAPGPLRNRLDLAQWLVDPRNPLTPRVTVNRIWMRYFGRGLVETEEDFGTQGSPPSHPGLLDALAREFIASGWSQKLLHRQIVSSATYRQASRLRPELQEKDPRNLLLGRQERLRLDAEPLRDAALVAAGVLDRTLGGPSVRPPQPEGVYAFTQRGKEWKTETGPARYRRALYTLFIRSAPYPLFTTFDAPDFQQTCTRRGRSNTPLQSLTLANDPAFVELFRLTAARVLREAADAEARVTRLFQVALARDPTPAEHRLVREFVREQTAAYTADPAAARRLLALEAKAPAPSAEAAAWMLAARAVLNTDGFITRE